MWKRRARTRGEHPEGNLKIASAHCLTVLSGEVMTDDQGFLFDFHDLVHWATCEISMILVVCVVLGKCLFKSRCARHRGQHNPRANLRDLTSQLEHQYLPVHQKAEFKMRSACAVLLVSSFPGLLDRKLPLIRPLLFHALDKS